MAALENIGNLWDLFHSRMTEKLTNMKMSFFAFLLTSTLLISSAFANDHTRMYVPWSQEDAMNKLDVLLSKPSPSMGKISDWTNGTIDRMLDIMTGKGEQWRRDGQHYRTPVSESKY